MTGCFTKQLLAGNLYYRLENSCYTYSSLPGNLSCTSLYVIILNVHHFYLNIAQNIRVYSTLTHQAVPYESVDTMTWLNCLRFGGFCQQLLRHFPTNIWQICYFSSFPLHDLTFSLTLNVFNARQ